MSIPKAILEKLQSLDVEDVALRLGIDVKRHKCHCFMHNDKHPSLSFNRRVTTQWYCFVCAKGGNAISFVMEHQGLDFIDACRCLCHIYGIQLSDEKVIRPKIIPAFRKDDSKAHQPAKKFNIDVCQALINCITLGEKGKSFLVQERKIKEPVIKELKIGSIEDSKIVVSLLREKFPDDVLRESGLITEGVDHNLWLKFFTPCIVFPYYSKDGILVGVQTRYIGDRLDVPRFQFLSGQKSHIFNLQILNSLSPDDDIYISEGITDCLALLSDGKNAIAIPSATILPEDEIKALISCHVHMYPDNDEAGMHALDNLRRILIPYETSIVHHRLPKEFKDYGEYHKAGCPVYKEDEYLPLLNKLTIESLYHGIYNWLDSEEVKKNPDSHIFPRLRSLFEILLIKEIPNQYKLYDEVYGLSNYLVARDEFMYNWSYMSKVWPEYISHLCNYRKSIEDAIEIINRVFCECPRSHTAHIRLIINECICIGFSDKESSFIIDLDLDKCSKIMCHKNDTNHSVTLIINGFIIAQLHLKGSGDCCVEKILNIIHTNNSLFEKA